MSVAKRTSLVESSVSKEVKIVLVGDVSVGKTCIALRYVVNNFNVETQSTIGASFLSKTVVVDSHPYKLQIWDTAGEEKYASMAPIYYRNASVAILVYDATKSKSFDTLRRWAQDLQKLGPKSMLLFIACNKCDLENTIAPEATTFASQIGAVLFQTSAKDNTGIDEMFTAICRQVGKITTTHATTSDVNLADRSAKKSGCC